MKKQANLLFLILAICLLIPAASQAQQTAQKIYFNPFPKGALAKQVEALWLQDPEYKDYVDFTGMAPDHMLGTYDLNGDGQMEVFARHSDYLLGFCDDREITCRMHVYANAKGKLIEIGRMMTQDPVAVSTRSNKGVRDLIITDKDGKRITFIWDGKQFEKK